MTIFGWDASDFDWSRGPMDLMAARVAGVDFFTHKATEGTGVRHVHYGEALNRAHQAGIPFLGAYHVVRTASVASQVAYLLAYVDQATPWWRQHPGWFFQCDLEHWSYDAVGPSRGVAFCEELEQQTGRRVLLYAPRWAYGDTIGGTAPLWASSYVTGSGGFRDLYPGDASSRWAPYSGRTPVVLQYTSSATIGRQSTCDANAFRGTVQDFAKLIRSGDDMTSEQWATLLRVDERIGTLIAMLDAVPSNGEPNKLGAALKAAGAGGAAQFDPALIDALAAAVANTLAARLTQ